MLRTRNTDTAWKEKILELSFFRRTSLLEKSLSSCVRDFCRYHHTQAGLGAFHPPGDASFKRGVFIDIQKRMTEIQATNYF